MHLSGLSSVRLLRPPALAAGDRVRVVATAGNFDAKALQAGLAVLRAQGLRPVVPAWPAPHSTYAGARAARSADLRAALEDDDAAAIWAVRGGSGTAQLLGDVEISLGRALRRRPRWLLGFSDLTSLHARLYAHGLQSMHCANLVNLTQWSEAARAELFARLSEDEDRTQTARAEVWLGPVPSGGTGPLVGGNLTVLASLVGTGVLPSWQGATLFLEDVAEAPYRLNRALEQLLQSGQLRGLKAVLLGQFTKCGDEALVRALIVETLAPLGLATLGGLPWGHAADSRAIVLGGQVELVHRGAVGVATYFDVNVQT